MGYSESVLHSAQARLAAQRSAWRSRQEATRQEIFRTLPRAREIDRKLRQTMAQVVAAALREGVDPGPALAHIRAENQALQRELSGLLTSHGWSAGALEDKPMCPKCGDTGWVGAGMCDCLKALCAQEQLKELSQLLDLGEQSFEKFDFSYYSPEVWPDWGRSPRENMEKVYKICRDYARNFGRYYFDNLFLSGGTGLGKTFLSACIARTVSENGFSVVYETAGNLFAQFETEKFSRDGGDAREARDGTRRYLGCDLLVLDDLGSELSTPFVQSALYRLVNSRLAAGRRTVVSSNLTMDDVRLRYTPQIASRLEGEYRVLPFFGQDIRLQRKQRL
ncbi:ATP-binding protein [uncultured Intestinimonas sp.]|uniref:ATP-binding protein n=1 Tax=uncultured Intestinimonas sp. TaxID=1689265 RepID=UPI0025F9C618|nr:ATP-binding protein [uncultured Intestinimonas sp.]